MSHAKTAEPIEIPLGMWTRAGPLNRVLGGSTSPCKGAILRRKVTGLGHAGTCPAVDILRATQQGKHRYGADADWCVLHCVHEKNAPSACLKIFKISKFCAITIQQHEYLSIFNKTANFSESLSYRD